MMTKITLIKKQRQTTSTQVKIDGPERASYIDGPVTGPLTRYNGPVTGSL